MKKSYIFNDEQLKLLLKGLGYDTVLALNLGGHSMDNETVLANLNQLMKNGVIMPDTKSFIVLDEIKSIINIIGSAKSCLIVRSSDKELPNICLFYDGNTFAASVRCGISGGRHSVCQTEIDGFIKRLLEEGYFSEDTTDIEIEDNELEPFEYNKLDSEKYSEIQNPVILSVDCLSKANGSIKKLYLIRFYFYDYILYFNGADKTRLSLNSVSLKKMLLKLLEES